MSGTPLDDALDVVVATRVFSPEPVAAAARHSALTLALARRGARVRVLTSRPPRRTAPPAAAASEDSLAARGAAAVRVSRWPVLRDAGGNVRGYAQYASFDGPLVLRLLWTFARGRPDVVVVEPPPTTGAAVGVAAALARRPYAYYAGDLLAPAARGAGAPRAVVRAVRDLEGRVLRGAAVVLAVSEGVAALVRQHGVRPERVVVVGTGVDTTTYSPCPEATVRPDLVYAGTLSEVHGAGVLLEGFERLHRQWPSARLVVRGQGTDADAVRRLASRLPAGAVDAGGLVAPHVVASLFRSAAAGLSSLRAGGGYEFAYTTKALAAAACGAPVVHAGGGPVADLVREHRWGWAVPWDASAVATAMDAAVRRPPGPGERRRIAAEVRGGHSLEAVASRAAAAVEDVVRRAPR